ncbi:MAG TPA: transposase [Thermoanaerobaculia bacterium]|nr:transposase [Thermoanaerobaculia bacterium]
MARPLRIDFPGAVWHLTSRGVNDQMIFVDDDDRRLFISLLGQTVRRFRWILIDYTLMGNHIHVIAEMTEANVSRGMKWLLQCYAQRFNKRHGRRGHLVQGRFWSGLISSDEYLEEVCRYLTLNPVRAGLVKNPADWKWSSYRAKIGLEPAPEWLSIEPGLSRFGPDLERARANYRQFVETLEPVTNPWEKLVGQVFLGGPEFIAKVRERIEREQRSVEHPKAQRHVGRPRMPRIVKVVARENRVPRASIRRNRGGDLRSIAAHLGWHEGKLMLREIADALGLRSVGYVSSMIRLCDEQAARDPDFANRLGRCRELIRPAPPPKSRLGEFVAKR